MNKKVSTDSIVISLLAAAAIKFAYGVENIYVVLGINITLIIGLYFILSGYNKNTNNKKEENRKIIIELIEKNNRKIDDLGSIINKDNILQQAKSENIINILDKKLNMISEITNNISKQSQAQMEQLVSAIYLQGNKNIDNIQTLIYELKIEMGTFNKEISCSINESIKINSEAKSVLKEIYNENIELSKKLSSNQAKLVEKLIDIEDKIGEGNNKTDVIISSIVDNSKYIKIVNEDIVESNKKLGEIITKSEEEVDKLIDIKSSLGNLNDKVEDMTKIDRENQDILSDIKDNNDRLNLEIINKIDESIESNNNIVTRYDFIQKSFTVELLKVATKNENITNMLIDNYKILKEVVDSI